jgi:dipeptidyl aminopeptidase/acylaminoacyl peptidase
MPRRAPYGSWVSPITASVIASGTIRLASPLIDRDEVYWLESRPTEGGRNVVARAGRALTPAPFNVRTRVHEYGGGALAVADGTIYFCNWGDQRIYRQRPDAQPEPLTAPGRGGELRYADLRVDPARERIYCVLEDHTGGGRWPKNALASVSLLDGAVTVLAEGRDFYSTPALSRDGRRLAWQCWDHPNMPWDGCELWLAELASDGAVTGAHRVAGGPSESIFQPEWSPGGVLHFVSDRSGWWNLYRLADGRAEPVFEIEAELGQPQWSFGGRTYGFDGDDIVLFYDQAGVSHLARLDARTGRPTPIETGRSSLHDLRVGPGFAVVVGGSPTEPNSVLRIDLGDGGVTVLRRSSDLPIDPGYVSLPRAIEFPTEGGLNAHAFFYPPTNRDYAAPEGERPPLLVISHGGPTSATDTVFDPSIQYWTSRGIAVLDVNYGGSTGYGRAYRQRLNGQWGVVDVDDCLNGARYLVERGEVDRDRLAIRGGSAGGYTTLAALAFRDLFRAGASYYGVSDLEALATDTHKFESRYLDSLIGPYPERRDLYLERSPLHHADRLNCPVIFFQGLEDKVVPPNQAEPMVEALRRKGVPVEYLPFEGEQHGFRKAENIQRALEAELAFYARVFRFALPAEVAV